RSDQRHGKSGAALAHARGVTLLTCPLHLNVRPLRGTVQTHRLQKSPGTWVTVYRYFGHRKEVPDALEPNVTHGPTNPIHRRLPAANPHGYRALRALPH